MKKEKITSFALVFALLMSIACLPMSSVFAENDAMTETEKITESEEQKNEDEPEEEQAVEEEEEKTAAEQEEEKVTKSSTSMKNTRADVTASDEQSLRDAIAAVPANNTEDYLIKITKDINVTAYINISNRKIKIYSDNNYKIIYSKYNSTNDTIFSVAGNGLFTLENVTLTNAEGIGNSDVIYLNSGSNLLLNKVTIENVQPSSGIANEGGNATINDCIFRNNNGNFGSAIVNHYGNITINGGKMTGNKALLAGGAIYNQGNMVINGTIFKNNEAQFAGAIFNGNKLTLKNVVIQNNKVVENSSNPLPPETENVYAGRGGGILTVAMDFNTSTGPDVIIEDTIIKNNTANEGGGIATIEGMFSNKLFLKGNTQIIDNKASAFGGGIYSAKLAITVNGASSEPDYHHLFADSTVVFGGNTANEAYEPPEDAETLYSDIKYKKTSIMSGSSYVHPLNNYDINYVGEKRLLYALSHMIKIKEAELFRGKKL